MKDGMSRFSLLLEKSGSTVRVYFSIGDRKTRIDGVKREMDRMLHEVSNGNSAIESCNDGLSHSADESSL